MDEISSFKARSGDMTASINGMSLHSRFNPVQEAERFVSEVRAATVVIAGLGLGYLPEALLRKNPHVHLIVAEADRHWSAQVMALRRNEMGTLFENPNFSLFTDENPHNIIEMVRRFDVRGDVSLLKWRPSVQMNPPWYGELETNLNNYMRRVAVNQQTLDQFGHLWIRNISCNLPFLGNAIALAPWENSFEGIPALIVAGGPSLEESLPHLSAMSEGNLIIAVDTALSGLKRAGVPPDIVAAVDPQYWNTRHLDWCEDVAGDALILSEASAHSGIFRSLKGRPWLSQTHFPLAGRLEEALGIRGRLKAGGSVATAAWDLAKFLGCGPLSISGLDLGFPGGKTHYSGSLSRSLPHYGSSRTSPAEDSFYHFLYQPTSHMVEAVDGSTLISDGRMDIYCAWFSESCATMVKRKPASLSRSGRRIAGMGFRDLTELEQMPPCREKINRKLKEIKQSPQPTHATEKLMSCLCDITTALASIRELAEEAVSVQNVHKRDKKMAFNELKSIDEKILDTNGRDIVSFLIQPIIREIEAAALPGSVLEKSERLYELMADSASCQMHYLEAGMKRMEDSGTMTGLEK